MRAARAPSAEPPTKSRLRHSGRAPRSDKSAAIKLESTPPELSADIVDKGIVLAGGGALLRDIDVLFREETGLPVLIADDPIGSVVLGAGMALDNPDLLREVVIR